MEENINEKKFFGFAIEATQEYTGELKHQTKTINNGIQTEIVIMKMRAFLENIEKEYFDDFNKSPEN